jgi:hypothetical protein
MASDIVVALGRATAEGHMLFGYNSNRAAGEGPGLMCVGGRAFAPGEAVCARHVQLPQVRQTYSVLAAVAPGHAGYTHGVNDHGVAAGVTSVHTRLGGSATGLTGPELVRLALERAVSARQAVDVVTDLVARFGQCGPDGNDDSALLLADGREAFVVETAGRYWAEQVVGSVRAVSDFCGLRQDWDRIARGLADEVIGRGWWPSDGSKVDFAGAVGREHGAGAAGLRRWGRATLLLEQQSGQVDMRFLRRLLADHGDRPAAAPSLCRHGDGAGEVATACSMVVEAGLAGALPVAWCSFGPPCLGVWFPLFLVAELPVEFAAEDGGGCRVWRRSLRLAAEVERSPESAKAVRQAMAAVQERFDQEGREFLVEAAALAGRADGARLARLAGSLMQHHVERWEEACDDVCPPQWRPHQLPRGSTYQYAPAGD